MIDIVDDPDTKQLRVHAAPEEGTVLDIRHPSHMLGQMLLEHANAILKYGAEAVDKDLDEKLLTPAHNMPSMLKH
jgi:hypothetical protein